MRYKKYVLMLALFGLAIICLQLTTNHAEAATCTWTGNVSADSTIPGNWNTLQVPTTADTAIFSSVYNVACTWKITATLNNITINGYSGTITLAKNMAVGSGGYYQTSGTIAPSGYYLNTSGNVIRTGGSMGIIGIQFFANSIWNTPSLTPIYIHILPGSTVTERCTITSAPSNAILPFNIDSGGILNIASGYTATIKVYGGSPPAEYLQNLGTIQGNGTLSLVGYSTVAAHIKPGIINCPITALMQNGGTGNMTIQLDSVLSSTSSLTISSSDAIRTMTINANGQPITIASLIVSARGGLITNSTVTVSGSWDTSAGKFITATGSVFTTGTGTTKLASNQDFYNLDSTSSAIRTMLSNVWIKNHLGINGTINEGVFYKNISSNIAIPLDLYSGSFSSIYMNGTSSAYQVNFIGPMTGYVYSKASVTYHGPAGNIVTYSVGSSYIGTKVQLQTFPTKYQYSISYPTGVQLMLFQVSGLKSVTIYNVSVNGVNLTQIQSNFTGIGSYTLAGPWSFAGSAVVLNQVIPAVTPIPPVVKGQDYTGMVMALLFLGLVTLFNLLGYIIRIRVIMLAAICILLPGVVWAFLTIPQYSLIPLLFIVVNVVLFVMDLTGGRKQ